MLRSTKSFLNSTAPNIGVLEEKEEPKAVLPKFCIAFSDSDSRKLVALLQLLFERNCNAEGNAKGENYHQVIMRLQNLKQNPEIQFFESFGVFRFAFDSDIKCDSDDTLILDVTKFVDVFQIDYSVRLKMDCEPIVTLTVWSATHFVTRLDFDDNISICQSFFPQLAAMPTAMPTAAAVNQLPLPAAQDLKSIVPYTFINICMTRLLETISEKNLKCELSGNFCTFIDKNSKIKIKSSGTMTNKQTAVINAMELFNCPLFTGKHDMYFLDNDNKYHAVEFFIDDAGGGGQAGGKLNVKCISSYFTYEIIL